MADEYELREVPEPSIGDGGEPLRESATDWVIAGSAAGTFLTVAGKAIWHVRRDMRHDAEHRLANPHEELGSGFESDDYYPGLTSFDAEPFEGFGVEDDDPPWYP